jgi:hypothetical protein
MHRRRGRVVLALQLISAVLALAGCARKDLDSEMSRTRSWTATLKLADQQHGLGATNDAVTRQLLDRAIQARMQEEPLLARYAKSDSERVAARGVLDSLDLQIRQLERVIP